MADQTHGNQGSGAEHVHHHHILADKVALGIGGALLFLTWLTVWVAGFDFGRFNLLVAMAVATTKALLVALFFMNLLYDRRENSVIFGTSFVFLAIFIVLTGSDLFFRGDVYVKEFFEGKPLLKASTGGPSVAEPWVAKPELVSAGKEQYTMLCASCHGAEGRGDGLAAASLNPKPRNFHGTEGWINGRKFHQLFKTVSEGVNTMPSFGSLPAQTRMSIVHYVMTFFESPAGESTEAELASVGIDTKGGGATQQKKREVPINIVIDQMVREAGGS